MSHTIPKTLQHLTRKERKALEEFVAQLRARYPNELVLVRLFGSKARGNFDEESDIDVLVVVQDDAVAYHDDSSPWAIMHRPQTHEWHENIRRPIIHLTTDLQLKHSANISPLIMPDWEYNFIKAQNMLLYRNLQKHGVNLWTKPKKSPTFASVSKPHIVTSPLRAKT